jgi:hypothetical protein
MCVRPFSRMSTRDSAPAKGACGQAEQGGAGATRSVRLIPARTESFP